MTDSIARSACSEQLFVLGAPRSGTTFLASLLAGTRFGTPVESHFITKYYKRLHRYEGLDSFRNLKRLLDEILAERAVMQWKVQVDLKALHLSLQDCTGDLERYSRVVEALFLARPRATGRQAWGDKTPHYLADVAILDQLFPCARYIYIVRDGRDVALSLMRKSWGPNNILAAAEYWHAVNADQNTLQHLRDEKRMYFLRYEDLAADVEGHICEIGQFLNEEVSDSELARLGSTVKQNNSFKWQKQMSPQKIRLFDSVAGGTLESFGYRVTSDANPPSTLIRGGYRLHNRLMWLCFMFNTNVIDGFRIRFLGKEPFAD